LVAATVSYRHLSGLLHFYGEEAITATIGPLAVDGLMVMATAALLATGQRRRPEPITQSSTFDVAEVAPDSRSTTPVAVTSDTASADIPAAVPEHLLPTARFSIVNHEQTTGRAITASELAARMSITPAVAGQLLATLAPAAVAGADRVNGTPIGGN
jgi:hypothetical protein